MIGILEDWRRCENDGIVAFVFEFHHFQIYSHRPQIRLELTQRLFILGINNQLLALDGSIHDSLEERPEIGVIVHRKGMSKDNHSLIVPYLPGYTR